MRESAIGHCAEKGSPIDGLLAESLDLSFRSLATLHEYVTLAISDTV